jgi:pilus assembly protein Flp/PilA
VTGWKNGDGGATTRILPGSTKPADWQRIASMQFFRNFINNESGATAIEYGLIAGLISVVIIGAVTAVGTRLAATFNTIASALTPAP